MVITSEARVGLHAIFIDDASKVMDGVIDEIAFRQLNV